jgi:hypothetical protein
MRHGQRRQGVPRLVVGDALLLLGAHHAMFLFKTKQHAIDRFLNIFRLHSVALTSCRQQSSFIDDICQIGTDHSGSLAAIVFKSTDGDS